MKNCIKCGHPLEESAKFCAGCGAKQPDLPKKEKKEGYSASIGDKNVISGNVVGKNEEYNVSGNATINKIEDDTKKFIKCAVSGRHLLRGRDNIVTCPKCNSDVAHDCFNNNANRCFNCDKVANESYSKRIEHFLVDGLLDSSERIELDSLALSLVIDEKTKVSIEENVRQNLIKSKNAGIERELSGFHKIQFKKALKSIYEEDKLSSGLEKLLSIHKNNIQNDEVASHYYLVKSIEQPEDYIEAYQNRHKRSVDVYWEDYWAFLPYIKSNMNEKADSVISANKARFSDRENDILISEVIFYYVTHVKTKDPDYLELAKEIYSNFGKSVKPPLIPIVQLLDKLLSGDTENSNLDATDDTKEVFYMKYLFIHDIGTPSSKSSGTNEVTNASTKTISGSLNEADIYYKKGLAKAAKEDSDGAITEYTKAIEIYPMYFDAYLARANAKNLSDPDGAIADYSKAIEINPKSSDAYGGRAFAKVNGVKGTYDYIGAIEDCSKSIEINPIEADCYYIRARSRLEIKDYDRALVDYKKAIEYDQDNEFTDAKNEIKKIENIIAKQKESVKKEGDGFLKKEGYNNPSEKKTKVKPEPVLYDEELESLISEDDIKQSLLELGITDEMMRFLMNDKTYELFLKGIQRFREDFLDESFFNERLGFKKSEASLVFKIYQKLMLIEEEVFKDYGYGTTVTFFYNEAEEKLRSIIKRVQVGYNQEFLQLVLNIRKMSECSDTCKKEFRKMKHWPSNTEKAFMDKWILLCEQNDTTQKKSKTQVIPKSIGIKTKTGKMHILFNANTKCHSLKKQMLTTSEDNKTFIEIKLYQGEDSLADNNTSIGDYIVEDIPKAPKGQPKIEVTFKVDKNGDISLTGLDKISGKNLSVTKK